MASIASIAPLMGVPGFLFTRALSRDVEGECISRAIRAIADGLNDDGVPTGQGGNQWYAATVRHVLLRTS